MENQMRHTPPIALGYTVNMHHMPSSVQQEAHNAYYASGSAQSKTPATKFAHAQHLVAILPASTPSTGYVLQGAPPS